jgi:hypothetical protein
MFIAFPEKVATVQRYSRSARKFLSNMVNENIVDLIAAGQLPLFWFMLIMQRWG